MADHLNDLRRSRAARSGEKKMSRGQSAAVVLGIAAIFFGFAGLMTLAAPMYSILLRRGDGGVSVRIEQRLLWWIPLHAQTVERVSGVKTTTEQPAPGEALPGRPQSELRTAETIGYLVLSHANGETRTMVSPENLAEVREKIEDFLRGGPAEMQLRTVANWKVAVIVPAILAGFGGLVVLLFLWGVIDGLFRKRE